MKNTQAIARFQYLSNMIGKYAHLWNKTTSDRLNGWVYEYNQLRDTHYDAFCEYCNKNEYSTKHDAYDCLA